MQASFYIYSISYNSPWYLFTIMKLPKKGIFWKFIWLATCYDGIMKLNNNFQIGIIAIGIEVSDHDNIVRLQLATPMQDILMENNCL